MTEAQIGRKRDQIAKLAAEIEAAELMKKERERLERKPVAPQIQYRLPADVAKRSKEIAARRDLTENEQARGVYMAWLARQP